MIEQSEKVRGSDGGPPLSAGPRQGRWVVENNMYCAYILKSETTGQYYTGSTFDLDKRLIRHNSGRNRSTKKGIPWLVVYYEVFDNRNEAYKREMQIKSYKGGEAFKKLVS